VLSKPRPRTHLQVRTKLRLTPFALRNAGAACRHVTAATLFQLFHGAPAASDVLFSSSASRIRRWINSAEPNSKRFCPILRPVPVGEASIGLVLSIPVAVLPGDSPDSAFFGAASASSSGEAASNELTRGFCCCLAWIRLAFNSSIPRHLTSVPADPQLRNESHSTQCPK